MSPDGATIRAVLTRPGEDPQIVDLPADTDRATYTAVSGLVGGNLEIVSGPDWHLYCDEDYLRKNLPPNGVAAAILEELEPGRGRAYICGPVLFLGNSTGDGREQPVPPRVEEIATRMRAGSLLLNWDDASALELGPPGGSADAQTLQLAAMAVRRAVTTGGWQENYNALACVRVGMRVLSQLGHTSIPLPVTFAGLSKLCAETQGRQGHCIGVAGTGKRDPHAPGGGSWDGHLVLLVDGRWLLDIAAPMFDRPAHGIPIPEPYLGRLPTPHPDGLADGTRLAQTRADGSVLRYRVTTALMWQDLPDWLETRTARVEQAADAAMRLIDPWKKALAATAMQPGDAVKHGLWRCQVCTQGVKRIILPDGTTQYVHTRPWEKITHGHDVVPEHVQDINLVQVVCDFCSDPNPIYAYTGPNIRERLPVNPLTGKPAQPGETVTEGLGAEWAGCALCDPYVRAGDIAGLFASVQKSKTMRKALADATRETFDTWAKRTLGRWQQFIPNITRRRLVNPPPLEPVNPRTLPKHRQRLIRFLSDERYPAFGGQPKGGTLLPGPDVGLPDVMTGLVQEVTPQMGAAYTERIIRGLELAELYHVSEDFTGLAMASGADLTDLSLTPEELPAPHGLVMWATPVMTADARHTRAADEAHLVAASWTTVSGLGVWINWYVRTDQLYPGEDTIRADAGILLPWAHGSGLKFGGTYVGAYDDTGKGFPEHDADGLGSFRTLLATWFLINQPGVAEQEVAVTNDKQMIKRAARAGQPAPTVRLVDLRHAKQHRAPADGTGTGRQITVRFPVRGHWRRQAYGPKRGLRRSMYIAPFMKGPEGAPLKSGGTVPLVRVLK